MYVSGVFSFFVQAEDGIRDVAVTGVQTCALPISRVRVEEIAAVVGLAALQFHGDEDSAYCAGWPWRTIKALRARPGADLAHEGARYATDYLLIDSYELGRAGGTGRPLDPAAATGLPAGRLFVAGGLRPE